MRYFSWAEIEISREGIDWLEEVWAWGREQARGLNFLESQAVTEEERNSLRESKLGSLGLRNPGTYTVFLSFIMIHCFSSDCYCFSKHHVVWVDMEGHLFVCWDITLCLYFPFVDLNLICPYCGYEMSKNHVYNSIWCGFPTCSEGSLMKWILRGSLYLFIFLCSVSPLSPASGTCSWDILLLSSLSMGTRGYKEYVLSGMRNLSL